MDPAFAALTRMRRLRGTRFDPFGRDRARVAVEGDRRLPARLFPIPAPEVPA